MCLLWVLEWQWQLMELLEYLQGHILLLDQLDQVQGLEAQH